VSRTTTAVILAAGAGRRLGLLGGASSKAMVRVGGRPLIEWVVDRLRASGVKKLVIVSHDSDESLQRFVRDVGNATLVTQHERLGIADALLQALPALDARPGYLACACDSLFEPEDLRAIIGVGESERAAVVVGVQEMGEQATSTRSAVELRGDFVERIVEKPAAGTARSPMVALPLYWLTAAVSPHLRSAAAVGGERHISTALNDFISAGGRVRAVAVAGRIEITSAADVARAEKILGPA
jgi:NDP-sugar pyrophosphorylase family protein